MYCWRVTWRFLSITFLACEVSEVAQSCLTLCDPMDCSLPGSSVRGILQARILEWVAVSFSRWSSQPRIEPGCPTLQADALPSEPPGKSCFFNDPTDFGNLISGSSAFSKSSLNIWKFSVHVLLKPHLENFEHCFASIWDECNCTMVWTFFGIAFLWYWNENWPCPVLWPLWVY